MALLIMLVGFCFGGFYGLGVATCIIIVLAMFSN